MSTVEEIEQAIEKLPRQELARLANRIRDLDNPEWDNQMDEDAASGKLDFLVRQAKDAREKNTLRDWPTAQS